MTLAATTDRIEKELLIEAPLSRVWQILSNGAEFGNWFGATLEDRPFEAGQHLRGLMTIPGYEHKFLDIIIERVEPETYLSYRWHPCCSKENVDHSGEPRTLVEFQLSEAGSGTLLRVVESGFDSLLPARREAAFRSNSGGWDHQMRNIERYAVASY